MGSAAWWFAPLLVALGACSSAEEPARPSEVSITAAPAAQGRVAEVVAVAWPAPDRLDRQALARVGSQARVAVASAPVPVLIPSAPAFASSVVVVTDEHWASAWAQADGVTVTVSGTRLAFRHPSIGAIGGTDAIRAARGFVTQNEGIWSATWREHGVTYTLDLECADPADPRCADRALLMEVASGLVYVGGRGSKVAP